MVPKALAKMHSKAHAGASATAGAGLRAKPAGEAAAKRRLKSDSETKCRIMEEAKALFFRFGFSKVTMDEAADSLGMSKKTLYRFFPSKEDLLLAVTSEHLDQCNTEINSILKNKDMDPLEKLKRYVNYITAIYAKLSEPLMQDFRKHTPEIWQMVEEHRQKCLRTDFGFLIKEGRQKGVFRKDVDERLFVLIYSHLLRDIMNPEVLASLPFKPNQVFDTVSKVIFEGLLTDKARMKYHAQ